MPYFKHQKQHPYQQTFRPSQPYPVDEDGDRIYTEEDYGVPADGDAFAPDDADVAPPLTYLGAYDSLAPEPEDGWEASWDSVPVDDLLTEEEREELRRSNWRLLAGLMDFGGVIVGVAAILTLIALLVSLMNWLINDVSQTFTLLQTHI